MRNIVTLFSCCFALSSLNAMQTQPWLGNWLEFEASIFQTHTESSHVDTSHGKKPHFLHLEKSTASLEFMPLENLSTEVAIDLAKTHKESYGFEALTFGSRYNLLNDLVGDPVSLTAGLAFTLSTAHRIKDLSSTENGIFQTKLNIACGREFDYSDSGYWHLWANGYLGAASSGSPWLGAELHIERAIVDTHYFDLFLQAEKGLSPHKLHNLCSFQGYSKIGYQYEEISLKYSYKKVALGSCFLQVTKRLHARYCPTDSWSVMLGVDIPFSPW